MASVMSLQPFFFPQTRTLQARDKPLSLSWACTDTTVGSMFLSPAIMLTQGQFSLRKMNKLLVDTSEKQNRPL